MKNGRSVAIVGFGVNNRPLVPYWLERGVPVVVADRRPQSELERELESWPSDKLTLYAGPRYLDQLVEDDTVDIAYLTPGMVKHQAQLEELIHRGVRLSSETDLFLSQSRAPVLGVTGSAGKTTTTTLIGEALAGSGKEVVVGGNIGRSLLPDLERLHPAMWAVMELSSFQLELVERSPKGAVWLNLSPNHLDVHGSMQAYARAKRHILEFQHADDDWAVLPYQDTSVLSVAADFGGRRYYVNLNGPVPQGAYLDQGKLWWRADPKHPAEPWLSADAVLLRGRHNLFNLLAAASAVVLGGGQLDAVAEVARSFAGVPHRLEIVRTLNGVCYINDSIATAPDRTVAALDAISGPTVLIAGGYDKHLDYEDFGRKVAQSQVRAVVLLGQTAEKIALALEKAGARCSVLRAENLERAVELARAEAQNGDSVLLSPASASYDMFTNFEERGRRFREIVGNL